MNKASKFLEDLIDGPPCRFTESTTFSNLLPVNTSMDTVSTRSKQIFEILFFRGCLYYGVSAYITEAYITEAAYITECYQTCQSTIGWVLIKKKLETHGWLGITSLLTSRSLHKQD